MISIIPFTDDRVVGIQVDGDISEQDVDDIWTWVDQKLSHQKKLRIYVECINFSGISFKALLKNIPKKLSHFSDFEKEAVVSDKGWLEKCLGIGDKIFPSIEIKHFSSDETQKAMDWIQAN